MRLGEKLGLLGTYLCDRYRAHQKIPTRPRTRSRTCWPDISATRRCGQTSRSWTNRAVCISAMFASSIPKGSPISLSERPFWVEAEAKRLLRLRHIAYNALWPAGILNFYILMISYRDLRASRERRKQGKAQPFRWRRLDKSCHPSVL